MNRKMNNERKASGTDRLPVQQKGRRTLAKQVDEGITKLDLCDPDKIAYWVEEQIQRLHEYDEARLIELTLYADSHQWHAFLLRAACVADLLRRTTRLLGGSGKRDSEGAGVQAQLEKLGAQFGKKKSTLRTDARIYDKFFSTAEERALAREQCLPREYYVIALASPDPQAAIHFAMEKSADPKFNREVFREHVRPQIKPDTATVEDQNEIALPPLRIHVPAIAQPALKELCELTGKGEEEIIVDAILALQRSLLQQENATRTSLADQPLLFPPNDQSEQDIAHQEQAIAPVKTESKSSKSPKSSSQKAPAKKASKDSEDSDALSNTQPPLLQYEQSVL